MQLIIPDNVKMIIQKLQENGYEAYAVGGCVRDSLLGWEPKDWDITTSALPLQIKSLFRRTVDVGIKHGTVVVMVGNESYEVTTYRIDGEYEDSRHPKEVTFTKSLAEDLKRRDFTINAMAYSEKDGLIDLFNGEDDLKTGVIRAVGNPEERFNEDALRMMRALRFSARYGYEIEKDTKEAIVKLAPTLANISAERIREELEKLIMSDNPGQLRLCYELGVTKVIFPEWDVMMECEQNTPYHYLNVGEHTIKAMEELLKIDGEFNEKDRTVLRIAAMLHDVGKPATKTTDEKGIDHFFEHPEVGAKMSVDILRRLKCDNDTINTVYKLVENHDYRPKLTYPNVRRAMIRAKAENMDMLMVLKKADLLAHSNYLVEERENYYEGFNKMQQRIRADHDCLSIKDLKVDGKDLIALGYKSGPEIGDKLNEMLEAVLDNPDMNDRDTLLGML